MQLGGSRAGLPKLKNPVICSAEGIGIVLRHLSVDKKQEPDVKSTC